MEEAIEAIGAIEAISLRDATDAEKRDPLPLATDAGINTSDSGREPHRPEVLVKGVLCKNGHFNHPRALYCAYDGSAMVDATRIEVDGPRLSLGVLVFDDGAAYSLESSYVVGRRPQGHPALESQEAAPLVLEDAQDQVSRSHVFLDLSGWDVSITDLSSRNGTFLEVPGAGLKERLAPNQPQVLPPGTRVTLGGRSFVYESHHRR